VSLRRKVGAKPSFRLLALCVVVIVSFGHRQLPNPSEVIDNVLAVVEGQVIMASDIRAFLALGFIDESSSDDSIRPVLSKLIERRLVLDEVDRFNIDEPFAAEVADRVESLVEQVGGLDSLKVVLEGVGYGWEDLEQILRDDLRTESYLLERFPSVEQPTVEEMEVRKNLINAWTESLFNRANVILVNP